MTSACLFADATPPATVSAAQSRKDRHRQVLDSLLSEARPSDTRQAARREAAVNTIRLDRTFTPSERYQIAAVHELLELDRSRPDTTREPSVDALVAMYSDLATEFPELPEIKQSIEELAERHPDPARARQIAQSLLASSTSSQTAVRAQTLIERLALRGLSLSALLPREVVGQLPSGNRPVVLYSWSLNDAASIAQAQELARLLSGHASLLGINLDTDPAAARACAAAAKLPAAQVYDPLGGRSLPAQRLMFSAPGLIYVTDDKGVITTVCAQLDLSSLAKTLRKR